MALKHDSEHVEHGPSSAYSAADLNDMVRAAEAATEKERQMGILQAIRTYPKAVFYSMSLSFCLVMEGYDLALTSNFFALPQFRERFGTPVGNGDYQITAPWMSALQNGAQVGQIIGLMITGIITDRFGYKKTLIGALFMMTCFILLFFFAQNIEMLLAGGILCGIPWGAFQILATTYTADITPIPLRHILTTYVNMCWVFGQLISVGVLRGFLSREDNWAWRIPYAIQWVFPPIIIIAVVFAPESPAWLVRKDRFEEARRSLRVLVKGMSDSEISATLAMITYTDRMEKETHEGTSYLDCFKGVNLRRTEITCLTWVTQVACGVWFGSNITYFLQQAGFSAERSFDVGVGQSAVSVLGTLGAWFLLPRAGRRRLYLVGLCTMLTLLMTIGFMGIPSRQQSIGWASGALMIVFVIVFSLTIGPVCYCLVAEIPASRLRVKTVVLARNTYNIVAIAANFLNAPILNPTAWNLRGKGGFVWAGPCALILVWVFFRLPETKGRSYAELDVLFEQGVSARKFATTEISAFEQELENKPTAK
ncbi:hypothetical protein LB504_010891 [Fusarium proliferatum]|nr:hypothetical protein LB504_010891 [Fusarium proliferatum]